MLKHVNFPAVLLSLLLLLCIGTRFVHLSDHFTHVDSVFMIMDILKAKDPEFKTTMMTRAYDQARPAYNSSYKRTLRYLNDHRQYQWVLNTAFAISPYLIISVTSTNPPLQFLANVPLLHDWQTYRQLLFWGRFPSFIYSVLALFLFIYILYQLKHRDFWTLALLGTLFFGFSWQHIIYAKQMYQYSINAFIAVVLLWAFIKTLTTEKTGHFTTLVPILLCYCSYQTFFLMPAFYGTLFGIWALKKNWPKVKTLVIHGCIWGIFSLPLLLYSVFNFVGYSTKYYQIGPHGEYLYKPALIAGIGAKVLYTVKFIFANSFITYRANIVPYIVETPLGLGLSILYFLLLSTGIFFIWKEKNLLMKQTGIFCTAILGSLVLIALTGIIPLSPCRLSLMYLPFFVFLTTYGTFYICTTYIPEKLRSAAVSIWVIVITVIFLFAYPRVMENRLDPVNDQDILQLVRTYGIQTVMTYNFSQNIHLMKDVIRHVNYFEKDYPVPAKDNPPWQYARILYFSTRTPLSEKVFEETRTQMNADSQIQQKNRHRYAAYRIAYKKEIHTATQVEFTKDNRNPTNDLYLTVLLLK